MRLRKRMSHADRVRATTYGIHYAAAFAAQREITRETLRRERVERLKGYLLG